MFNDEIVAYGKPFNIRKATTNHWYDVAIGNSNCHLSITLVNSESFIGMELYIDNNKDLFDALNKYKDDIETETDMTFDWQRLDDKKASRVLYKMPGVNFDDHSNYHELMGKIITKILVMRKVFKAYLANMS